MITRVAISNYKSCHETSFDGIGPFTVLVGRNGAGKSNILQAVDWVARTATSGANQRSGPFENLSVSVDFKYEDGLHRYSASTGWHQPSSGMEPLFEEEWSQLSGGVFRQIVVKRNSVISVTGRTEDIKVPPMTPCLPAIISLLPEGDALVTRLRPVLTFLASVRYYPMDETVATKTDPSFEYITDTAYATWVNDYKTLGRARDDVLMKVLHMSLTDEEMFQEFKDILGPQGLGIVDDIHVQKFQAQPQPKGKPESPNHFYFVHYLPSGSIVSKQRSLLPYSGLSHGTRRILRIVLALIFDESSVMLLEHPEDGIHPGLLNKLMSVLKSYSDPLQTIAASHSPEVFNAVDPTDIRLVSLVDGQTQIRPLSSHEIGVAKDFICHDGPFSDFLESLQSS